MSVSLVWVEGNRYAAWLLVGDNKVLLGYHFVSEENTREQIVKRLYDAFQELVAWE